MWDVEKITRPDKRIMELILGEGAKLRVKTVRPNLVYSVPNSLPDYA
jgi:hypothetical protein